MRTAKAIGFSPKWEFLEIADLLYRNDIQETGNEYNLVEALQRAIDENLSLKIDKSKSFRHT